MHSSCRNRANYTPVAFKLCGLRCSQHSNSNRFIQLEEMENNQMKKKQSFALFLVLILGMICVAMPAYAEGTSSIDWSEYSYDELTTIREGLDSYIKNLERQYAIENGNRIITLNQTDVSIYQSKTYTFEPDVKRVVEEAPENTEFIWTSSDETIATVSATGTVTVVGYGEAVITCTASDDEYIFAQATVHGILPVTGVTLNAQDVTLLLAEKDPDAANTTLHYSIEPENAFEKDVVWSTSDENVATVDDSGNIHAVAPGTAIITATSKDEFATPPHAACKVTVLQAVSSVSLDSKALTLNVYGGQNLVATIAPDTASRKDLIWESSNPEIATVAANGRISAVAPGTTKITCTATDGSECTATCEVTVIQMVSSLRIDVPSNTVMLNKGTSIDLPVIATPENATNKNVTWESSDVSVATVDKSGTVTAINGGVATIACTAADGSNVTAKTNIFVPSIAVEQKEYTVTSKDGLKVSFKYYGKSENLSFSPEKCTYFSAGIKQDGENITLTILPDKAGTASITLTDKSDSRSTTILTIKVDHSACYDSTSYPNGNYTDIMRSPSTYKGNQMSAYGRVVQVSNGLFSTVLRVATQGRWDNIFYVTCSGSTAEGIIEGDYITVYGECDGTETYTTVMGASVTIPSIDAEKIFLGRH